MRAILCLGAAAMLAGCGGGADNSDATVNLATITQTPAVMPDSYVGIWDADAAACKQATSEMRLTITPQTLNLYAGTAKVRDVKQTSDGGIDVRATLNSEGMTQERLFHMVLAQDKLAVTVDNQEADRVRCPQAAGNSAG